MSNGDHRHQFLDRVVGFSVERFGSGGITDLRGLFESFVDLGMRVAKLRVAGAEVEVKEVGG